MGDVTISGAKNAALGILAASIMTDDDVVIDNLPDVRDINVLLEAIQEIGARVDRIDRHTVKINGSNISEVSVDDEYIRRIRASYYFIGALLGKYNSAQVPLPGGCNIGSRPIDQHIKGFRALGAEVTIERGAVIAHAIDLVASHIYLDVFCGEQLRIAHDVLLQPVGIVNVCDAIFHTDSSQLFQPDGFISDPGWDVTSRPWFECTKTKKPVMTEPSL